MNQRSFENWSVAHDSARQASNGERIVGRECPHTPSWVEGYACELCGAPSPALTENGTCAVPHSEVPNGNR